MRGACAWGRAWGCARCERSSRTGPPCQCGATSLVWCCRIVHACCCDDAAFRRPRSRCQAPPTCRSGSRCSITLPARGPWFARTLAGPRSAHRAQLLSSLAAHAPRQALPVFWGRRPGRRHMLAHAGAWSGAGRRGVRPVRHHCGLAHDCDHRTARKCWGAPSFCHGTHYPHSPAALRRPPIAAPRTPAGV